MLMSKSTYKCRKQILRSNQKSAFFFFFCFLWGDVCLLFFLISFVCLVFFLVILQLKSLSKSNQTICLYFTKPLRNNFK